MWERGHIGFSNSLDIYYSATCRALQNTVVIPRLLNLLGISAGDFVSTPVCVSLWACIYNLAWVEKNKVKNKNKFFSLTSMTSGEQTAGMVAFSDISLGSIVHSQPRAILSASLRVLGRHDAFPLVGCTSHCSMYGSRSLLASAPWALRARVQWVRTGCKGLLGVETSVLTVRPALEANFWLKKLVWNYVFILKSVNLPLQAL